MGDRVERRAELHAVVLLDEWELDDPLLAGALEAGEKLGRFGDHGAELDQWIAPLFPDDDPAAQRLRLAACLLADVAWEAHPDFRALWAVDMGVPRSVGAAVGGGSPGMASGTSGEPPSLCVLSWLPAVCAMICNTF